MDVNVIRRVLKGLRANVYNQGVTVIVQLVGVPVLLYAWGAQLYGEWLILFAIPSYLSMTELGFSQSACNDMTARVARGDRTGSLVVFQSLAGLVYVISGTGLLLITALVWSLPFPDWLHFSAMDSDDIRWVLGLLAAQVFVNLPDGVNHAGFRASGDYALHVSLGSTTRLLQFVGVWIAALSGSGPVAAAAVFFCVRAVATPIFAFLLVRRHPWLHFGLAHAHIHELRRLLRPALANLAIPLAQALNIQGMVLAVGAMLGPLAVVVFSTLRTLTRLVVQLILAVSHAAEPEIATAWGTGNTTLMRSLFIHVLRAGLWLALTAVVGLGLFGSQILDLWTHGKVSMEPEMFAWLLASAAVSVLWFGALIVLKATNRHLHAAIVLVIASGVAVGVAVLLLGWTGDIATAGLSLLLMDVAMALYTLVAATRLLGVSVGTTLAQAINPHPLINGAWRKLHAW
jgi:O-antigen/teichoic acid export membrane protein